MNERILELYEQAVQLVADEHTKGDTSRLNTDAYHVKDLINVKFAELIVRECAEVLVTWNRENGAEEGLDKAGLISLWSPHFGVEE